MFIRLMNARKKFTRYISIMQTERLSCSSWDLNDAIKKLGTGMPIKSSFLVACIQDENAFVGAQDGISLNSNGNKGIPILAGCSTVSHLSDDCHLSAITFEKDVNVVSFSSYDASLPKFKPNELKMLSEGEAPYFLFLVSDFFLAHHWRGFKMNLSKHFQSHRFVAAKVTPHTKLRLGDISISNGIIGLAIQSKCSDECIDTELNKKIQNSSTNINDDNNMYKLALAAFGDMSPFDFDPLTNSMLLGGDGGRSDNAEQQDNNHAEYHLPTTSTAESNSTYNNISTNEKKKLLKRPMRGIKVSRSAYKLQRKPFKPPYNDPREEEASDSSSGTTNTVINGVEEAQTPSAANSTLGTTISLINSSKTTFMNFNHDPVLCISPHQRYFMYVSTISPSSAVILKQYLDANQPIGVLGDDEDSIGTLLQVKAVYHLNINTIVVEVLGRQRFEVQRKWIEPHTFGALIADVHAYSDNLFKMRKNLNSEVLQLANETGSILRRLTSRSLFNQIESIIGLQPQIVLKKNTKEIPYKRILSWLAKISWWNIAALRILCPELLQKDRIHWFHSLNCVFRLQYAFSMSKRLRQIALKNIIVR